MFFHLNLSTWPLGRNETWESLKQRTSPCCFAMPCKQQYRDVDNLRSLVGHWFYNLFLFLLFTLILLEKFHFLPNEKWKIISFLWCKWWFPVIFNSFLIFIDASVTIFKISSEVKILQLFSLASLFSVSTITLLYDYHHLVFKLVHMSPVLFRVLIILLSMPIIHIFILPGFFLHSL